MILVKCSLCKDFPVQLTKMQQMQQILSTYEGRLSVIEQNDSLYAGQIRQFFTDNPEFNKYGKLIPLTRLPIGYGLHSFEAKQDWHQKGFIEFLMHYICEAGVNSTYAHKQWLSMYKYLRSSNYDLLSLSEVVPGIQPGKIKSYEELGIFMISREIDPSQLGIQHINELEKVVPGVGLGAKAFLSHIFAENHGIGLVDYSDRGVISGFGTVYGITKPTKSQIENKIASWGPCKSIGGYMCMQVFHYKDKL